MLLYLSLAACSSGSEVEVTPSPTPTPSPSPTPDPEPTPTPSAASQGWPENYAGVMLQGFSWDSYDYSQWKVLARQADNLKGFVDLVWVPQSGRCKESTQVMGYTPYYYFDQNSSFGTESELRTMISQLKTAGIGIIADVVINHHNTDGWFSFPKETYNGKTYQLLSTDICADDDSGKSAAQAKSEGVNLSSNNDEGEDWDGMRDLDHKSTNVQTVVKAYVDYLKNDLGYAGFRYDMVKGYAGSHVADYNDAVGIDYSVGEYWDSNEKIIVWIKATGYKSAAFDFQFRYNVRDAINAGNWTKLNSTNNLMHDATLRRYAVTFVENHDTQYRSASEEQDPIRKDTLAANAYLLAMPGTPCLFQPHWRTYEAELKSMIEARKAADITNMSNYYNRFSQQNCYANEVQGDNANLTVVVGNTSAYTPDASEYTRILSGYHYAYYLSKTAEIPWISKASGTYEEGFKTTLTAVSTSGDAKLVYTTDGTTPTAKSTVVESGAEVSINSSCTLQVGLLVGGEVKKVVLHTYTLEKFKAYKIKVYVNADAVGWNPLYCYTWCNSNAKNNSSDWPGDKMTQTVTKDGKTWYWKEYSIDHADDLIGFVFNNGNTASMQQTVDKTGVNQDTYIELSANKHDGKYKFKD